MIKTKITNIDKAALIALRPEIDAALAEVAARFGLSMQTGSGSFGGNEASFKLLIKVDNPEVQAAAERAEFERYCTLYDLLPTDFGAEFTVNRKRVKLVGLNMSRRKYPIRILEIDTGKTVLMTDAVVLHIKMARTK